MRIPGLVADELGKSALIMRRGYHSRAYVNNFGD